MVNGTINPPSPRRGLGGGGNRPRRKTTEDRGSVRTLVIRARWACSKRVRASRNRRARMDRTLPLHNPQADPGQAASAPTAPASGFAEFSEDPDLGAGRPSPEPRREAACPGPSEYRPAAIQFARIDHISYNVRSLHHYARSKSGGAWAKRRRKTANIIALAGTTDVLHVQETWLGENECNAFKKLLPHSSVFYSNGEGGRRGVMTICSPRLTEKYMLSQLPTPEALTGRALLIKGMARTEGEDFHSLNVYFPNDAAAQVDMLQSLSAWDGFPTKGRMYLAGDFNFVTNEDDASSGQSGSMTGRLRTHWEGFLQLHGLLEVAQPTHTWFSVGADLMTGCSRRLDRIYVGMDAAEAAVALPSAYIAACPFSLLGAFRSAELAEMQAAASKDGNGRRALAGSDHLPVAMRFLPRQTARKRSNAVPAWVASDPLFQTEFDAVYTLEPNSSVADDINAFKSAARQAKKAVLARIADGKAVTLQRYDQFQTAVALLGALTVGRRGGRDLARAEHLLDRYPHLRELVSVDDTSALRLREFINGLVAEDMEHNMLLAAAAPPEVDPDTDMHRAPTPPQQRGRMNAVQRLKLLLPSSRPRLPGLRRVIDGPLITDPQAMAALAKESWGPVWTGVERSPKAQASDRTLLGSFDARVPAHLMPTIPSVGVIEGIIKDTNNSCAGPDGLAFQVYRTLASAFAPIMHRLLCALGQGEPPPEGFNEALLFLMSKGGTMTALDTRPLAVTNTDNRILAKCMVAALTEGLDAAIGEHQAGFLAGRTGDGHIEKMNDKFYNSVKAGGRAYHLLFLDLHKAYDSVHWDWMHKTLEAIGLPSWVLNTVVALLTDVKVTPLFGVRVNVWIQVTRGVRQGCPLSPLIFLVCYEPLLCRLRQVTPSTDRWAFADDLACGSYHLRDFSVVMRVMDLFQLSSGLGANVTKCVMISSTSSLDAYEAWIATGTVPWATGTNGGFQIKLAHPYLRIPMGRLMDTEKLYAKTVNKMVSRLYEYSRALRPLATARRVLACNVFVSSISTYLENYFLFPFGETPASAMNMLRKAIRAVIIPWGGTGFKYCHLVATPTGVGLGTQLVDIWARSVARLAEKADLIKHNGALATMYTGSDGRQSLVSATPLITDQIQLAATELVGWHLSGPGAPTVFDATLFAGSSSPIRRRLMYNRLVLVGYRREQDMDLYQKMSARGCCMGPESTRRLRRHFSNLPAKADSLRAHLFRALTNSLYSERRYLPVTQPDAALRAAIPRTPCFLCRDHDDGVNHVYGHCRVTATARSLFSGLTGIDISLQGTGAVTEADATFFNVDPQPKDTTLAMFVFARTVWDEARSFFQAVPVAPALESAAARVAEVASLRYEDELWRLRRGGAFGSSSNRTPAQRAVALTAALCVIERLTVGGIFVYTDGASNGNPGHSGAGVCFAGAGVGLEDQSWALGKSTNNIAELFALGAAAESVWVARAAGLAPEDRAFILTDSDINLSRLARPAQTGDDLLLQHARRALDRCRSQAPLGLIWVPGHVGVEGNERADERAGAGALDSMRLGLAEPCGSDGGFAFLTDHHITLIRAACARLLLERRARAVS